MKNRRHRFWIRLNTGAALLFATVIVLMLNYLSYRHYHRVDRSAKQFYSLSSKTTGLLDTLEKPVEVTVFFQSENVLYEDIHNLLREYQFHTDQLNIQWVDPDRDIAQTEELAAKYDVKEYNVVVFDCENRTTYKRVDEIAQLNTSSGEAKITAFKGEQAFSSAILEVVQKTVPVVYFLTGHGEGNLDDFDPRVGFSGLAQLIERDNIEIRPLRLSVEKQIPTDCKALVALGITHSMSKTESDIIGTWIHQGGRLLVLANSRKTSGLESLLFNWGVLLRDDIVLEFDPSHTQTGREVVVAPEKTHPVTEKLNTVDVVFFLPRSVEPETTQSVSADRPRVTPLAFSSQKSWSESQPNQSPVQYDKNTADRLGPISIAVAVEKGAPAGRLDMQIRPSRMIVFGDSTFVSNKALPIGANQSLFMSSLNWLLDREQLMAIAPKAAEDIRLKLTRGDIRTLFWSVVLGIPLLAALPGVVLWIRRRK